MERIPYGKYTKEFRQEAVKLVTEGGLSVLGAAKQLSLAPSTLSNWIKAFKMGKLGDVGKTRRFSASLSVKLGEHPMKEENL